MQSARPVFGVWHCSECVRPNHQFVCVVYQCFEAGSVSKINLGCFEANRRLSDPSRSCFERIFTDCGEFRTLSSFYLLSSAFQIRISGLYRNPTSRFLIFL
jgi:hypothetical protein